MVYLTIIKAKDLISAILTNITRIKEFFFYICTKQPFNRTFI